MLSLPRIAGLGLAAASVALAVGSVAAPAAAKCTKIGFSVNDYGKDGPTRDAKDLLDKYIAKWAADNKIAKYNVGKKDVSCELFLNFIVFDEHTCKAEATVCYNEPAGGVTPPKEANHVDKAAAKKTAKTESADKPAATTPRAKSHGPVVTRAKAPTETGTVPGAAADKAEAAKPVTAPVTPPAPPAAAPAAEAQVEKAAEAAAAAEKAAAAAERAAAAAERAAAAAKIAPAPAPAAVAPAAPAGVAPKAP